MRYSCKFPGRIIIFLTPSAVSDTQSFLSCFCGFRGYSSSLIFYWGMLFFKDPTCIGVLIPLLAWDWNSASCRGRIIAIQASRLWGLTTLPLGHSHYQIICSMFWFLAYSLFLTSGISFTFLQATLKLIFALFYLHHQTFVLVLFPNHSTKNAPSPPTPALQSVAAAIIFPVWCNWHMKNHLNSDAVFLNS